MAYLTARLPPRIGDAYGSGVFGAPRGDGRHHRGKDYAAMPGTMVLAPVNGIVTRLGWPYDDARSGIERYRYVEIEDEHSRYWRVMYVSPEVALHSTVAAHDTIIGAVQDIAARYPARAAGSMTNHVHLEVRVWRRHAYAYLDPDTLEETV